MMKSIKPTSGTVDCGLLLVGHGTRDSAGLDEFAELVAILERLLPEIRLQSAFLELATPDIPTGIERLVDEGVAQIIVMPVLLFAAGHAKRDIPDAIERAFVLHPQIRFAYSQPLECHRKLIELSELRFRDAADLAGIDPRNATLLLVGRGSHDEAATAAMHHYAGLLANRIKVREHRVAFIAMAQPSLESVLKQLASEAGGPIVVQPHLLFQGDLLHELWRQVCKFAGQSPSRNFYLTGHLGAAPLLAEALAEIAEQVYRR